MLKNNILKNGMSRIRSYGSAPPPPPPSLSPGIGRIVVKLKHQYFVFVYGDCNYESILFVMMMHRKIISVTIMGVARVEIFRGSLKQNILLVKIVLRFSNFYYLPHCSLGHEAVL